MAYLGQPPANAALTAAQISDNIITAAKIANETGTGEVVFSVSPTISLPAIDNIKLGYATTATAAGTTTLTSASTYHQYFTGTNAQTVQMPVTNTVSLGSSYHIVNNSTGNLTLTSSGGNTIGTVLPGTTVHITCIDTTVSTAAGWDFGATDFSTVTGTGNVVLSTNAVLTTPALGTPASGTLSSCTVDGTNKVGYLNVPQVGSAKVASYTLAIGDVGKFVVLGTSGTIVIPASVFAVGDAISIVNNTTGSIACTCSAITTVYKGGTDTNISATGFTITTRGVCTILFVTATTVVITGNLA